MDFLKTITSPLRKHNLYSSRRQLVDTEASSHNENDIINDEISKISPFKSPQTHKLTMEALNTKSIMDTDNSSERSISINIPLKDIKIQSNKSSREASTDEENKGTVLFVKETALFSSTLSESSDIDENKSGSSAHSSHRSNSNNSKKIDVVNEVKSPKIINALSKLATRKNKTSASSKTDSKKVEEVELKPLPKTREEKRIKRTLKLIGIHIIKSDLLKDHPFLIYPFVKIYLVDFDNGQCINLKNSKEILISTKSFDFVKHRTLIPQWNEIILFEDTIIEEVQNVSSLVIFFEIIDLPPRTNHKQANESNQSIAWAFVKPFGNNGKSNINRKIKLQLYEILERDYSTSTVPKVYECWKEKPWKSYPSVLYVTLKGIKILEEQDLINNMKLNIFNSIINNNEEEKMSNTGNLKVQNKTENVKKYEKWENGQQCKIPNKIVKCLSSKETGPFNVKFSYCGKYLAYSANDHDNFVVFVYTVPQFVREAQFIHHKKFIYDLSWNHSRNILLTASADSSVCIWDMADTKRRPIQKLAHPAFVYSSQFCPLDDTIVTGCYDKLIRIWTKNNDKDYTQEQELSGHEGFVNSICFARKSKIFYSADSNGIIIKWNHSKTNWLKMLTIKVTELRDCVINDLVIFPDNRRMLVVLRNSISWVLDTSTTSALLCFKDGFEYTYQLRGTISPCGTLVFIGNCIWNTSTGKILAIYNPNVFQHQTITATDFHPHYNFIAMGCGFLPSPLLVCEYKENFMDINMNIDYFRDVSYSNNELNNSLINEDDINTGKIISKGYQSLASKPSNHSRMSHVKPGSNAVLNLNTNDSKLWNLINKMDNVLLIARKGREYSERKSNTLKNEKNVISHRDDKELLSSSTSAHSDNESSTTISVDLSQFNRIFQMQADIHIPEGESVEAEKSEHTYVVGKDDESIKEIIIDDTPTLSAAESLDDDVHTYTISLNEQNIPKKTK